MARVERLPVCVGLFDKGESACIGNAEAQGEEAQPCAWHQLCLGFRHHLHLNKVNREQFIQVVGDGDDKHCMALHGNVQFVRQCQRFYREYKRWKKANRYRRKPGPRRKHYRKSAKVLELESQSRSMQAHFFNCIKESFPDRMITSTRPARGSLYVREKTQFGGFMVLCCWDLGGDLPVLLFKARKRACLADVVLPLGMASFQRYVPGSIQRAFRDVKAVEDMGKFRVILKNMDLMGLARLLEQVKRLVEMGVMRWPSVRKGMVTRRATS